MMLTDHTDMQLLQFSLSVMSMMILLLDVILRSFAQLAS